MIQHNISVKTMSNKSCLIAFVLLVCILGKASGQIHENRLTPLQNALVKRIAKDGTVKARLVSRTASTPAQWKRADSLNRISSIDDLSFLTNHQSSAVKIYAFDFLMESKNWQQALVAFRANYNNKKTYCWTTGCMVGYATVANSMARHLKSFFSDEKIVLEPELQQEVNDLFKKIPDRDKEKRIIKRQMSKLQAQEENSEN